MKKISLAHGFDPQEINKFDNIDATEILSVAQYRNNPNQEPIKAFEHSHKDYEFIIPSKTIHLICYEGFKIIGEVGWCYPVASNALHGVDHDLNRSDFVSVAIDYNYLQSRLNDFGYLDDTKFFQNRFPVKKEIVRLLKNFQDACRKEFPNDTIIDLLTKQITDWFIINGLTKEEHRRIPKREYDPNIRKTLTYMFLNFHNPDLTLKKLAFHCGYSEAYFSRVFKKYVGDSPITHLNKIRISEAKALFANDNLSLQDISLLVGFNNLSTFTESFKKITGEKPKEYRDRLLFL